MLKDPAKIMLMATYEEDQSDADGNTDFDSMPLFKLWVYLGKDTFE